MDEEKEDTEIPAGDKNFNTTYWQQRDRTKGITKSVYIQVPSNSQVS